MIECQGMVRTFGLQPALRGVDLRVAAGETVALVGPNGSGKTTLLRIFATLLAPSAGAVKVGGWPLPEHASRVRRYIGFLSHQPLLYGDLTAAENLRFFARLYDLDNCDGRVERALTDVGLAARQRDSVRTFSRGMTQRLALARATLHDPDILLLDEPYTGLDPAGIALLDERLRRERAAGRTIILVTHQLAHARIAGRIVVLRRGRIVAEVVGDAVSETALRDLVIGR